MKIISTHESLKFQLQINKSYSFFVFVLMKQIRDEIFSYITNFETLFYFRCKV